MKIIYLKPVLESGYSHSQGTVKDNIWHFWRIGHPFKVLKLKYSRQADSVVFFLSWCTELKHIYVLESHLWFS